VVQLVEARRYKPKDRGFDSLWCSVVRTITLGFVQSLREMSKGKGKVYLITGHEGQKVE
jgi:hypothetical protein